MSARRLIAGLASVVLAAAGGCDNDNKQTKTSTSSNSVTRLLDKTETVAKRPNPPGYQRACSKGKACVFGPAWTDNHNGTGGHNGCDTRNDVLKAQLTDVKTRPGTRGCVVTAGQLNDPYTGKRIHFTKANAGAVQIDHVFPLALAWDLGANTWSKERRIDFANDRDNLLAVDGPTNQSKGDAGPGEWLPINRGFRCDYVERFLKVANEYDLPITTADARSIRTTAGGC